MAGMANVARNGDKASVSQSKIARGGTSSPNGDLSNLALKGGDLALNPNASKPATPGGK